MTFTRANPLGWAMFENYRSAQANHIDINQSRAVDGYEGGEYNPSDRLVWNNALKVDTSPLTFVDQSITAVGCDHNDWMAPDGTGIAVGAYGGGSDTSENAGPGVYSKGGSATVDGDGGAGARTFGGQAEDGDGGEGLDSHGGSSTDGEGGPGIDARGGDSTNGEGGPGVRAYGKKGSPGVEASGGPSNGPGVESWGKGLGAGQRGHGGSSTDFPSGSGMVGEGGEGFGDSAGGNGGSFFGGDGVGVDQNGGDGAWAMGGDASGDGTPGVGLFGQGGAADTNPYGGIGVLGRGNGTGEGVRGESTDGVGIVALSEDGYAAYFENVDPNRATIRFIPKSSSPTSGMAPGDFWCTNSGVFIRLGTTTYQFNLTAV